MPHLQLQPCLSLLAAVALSFMGGSALFADQPMITGETKTWHKVTLTLAGPHAKETDTDINPFTDYRMTVTFRHEPSGDVYKVPGYFAADGNAAESSASEGNQWRAHFAPDRAGVWNYEVEFLAGSNIAMNEEAEFKTVDGSHGLKGTFDVADSDKSGRDFRGQGRLQYVGGHYLRFAESGRYFLKAGPDAPETLLAFVDFDDTVERKKNAPLKTWERHIQDWNEGDPVWKTQKGKGLIGAVNYVAAQGCNSISFLPYNAGGDGDNVWPFVSRDDKLHYDCSKLDQWQIIFDHAQHQGVFLHFKLQETEIDDERNQKGEQASVPTSLDGGKLGPERKLYCRELIARFGYELALNWNLGEENTQTPEEQRAMAQYVKDVDPYDHHIVIHSYPDQQDKVYPPLLGDQSALTGASLQNSWRNAHERTLKWIQASVEAGKPWVVCNDEQNPASHGVPPDPGYEGHDGFAQEGERRYDLHDVRKRCLWGTLLAGGAGVEYYFGYQLPQNDLICQDFRSREQSWKYCRIAIEFFQDHEIPFWEMSNADHLIGNDNHKQGNYCFAKSGELYLVYDPDGRRSSIDLSGIEGEFALLWFNPREGGELTATEDVIPGGLKTQLPQPPNDRDEDWLAVIRRK